jgi:hypothetical protein
MQAFYTAFFCSLVKDGILRGRKEKINTNHKGVPLAFLEKFLFFFCQPAVKNFQYSGYFNFNCKVL